MGIIQFHELFSIFFLFNDKLSRPVRFTIYYMKVTSVMALSGVFSQSLNQIQALLLSVIMAVAIGVPIAIICALFKTRYTKCIAFLLTLGFIGITLYISLGVSALMGVESANIWAQTYIQSWLFDVFMSQPLSTTIKLALTKTFLGKNHIIAKLMFKMAGEDIVKYFFD